MSSTLRRKTIWPGASGASETSRSTRSTTLTSAGEQLETLIEKASYRYFAYSVHTYVDMMIKFYLACGTPIPDPVRCAIWLSFAQDAGRQR